MSRIEFIANLLTFLLEPVVSTPAPDLPITRYFGLCVLDLVRAVAATLQTMPERSGRRKLPP